jgi:hypothetical protein
MASIFNPLILRLRATRRLGAFSRARRQGMSTEQARISQMVISAYPR